MYPRSTPGDLHILFKVPLILALSIPHTVAVTTLHFFAHTSCNTGTSLSSTTIADLSSQIGGTTVCHATPQGTVAIYVDGIDDGCVVEPYFDVTCTQIMGLPITAGQCWFLDPDGLDQIGSWSARCGMPASSSTTTSSNQNTPEPTGTTPSTGEGNNTTISSSMTTNATANVHATSVISSPTFQRLGTFTPTALPNGAGVWNHFQESMCFSLWTRWIISVMMMALGV